MAPPHAIKTPGFGIPATASVTAVFLSGKPDNIAIRMNQSVALIWHFFDLGAMTGLSAICIPVFLDTNADVSHMYMQWARLYHYGHIYMPSVAVSATGLYALAAARHRAVNSEYWATYAIAAVTTIAMVPFTWLIMNSTNNTLFRLHALADVSPSEVDLNTAQKLLVKWAWLHLCRSIFPFAGSILGFVGVVRQLRT